MKKLTPDERRTDGRCAIP